MAFRRVQITIVKNYYTREHAAAAGIIAVGLIIGRRRPPFSAGGQ